MRRLNGIGQPIIISAMGDGGGLDELIHAIDLLI
jgi:hypothetical protein